MIIWTISNGKKAYSYCPVRTDEDGVAIYPDEAAHAAEMLANGIMQEGATFEIVSAMPQTEIDLIAADGARALAATALIDIDARSIRAMREYIASKPDAPQILKDRDAAAVGQREKLR